MKVMTIIAISLVSGSLWAKSNNCSYGLKSESSEVSWVAYKTTEKKGVKGQFGKLKSTGKNTAKNLSELLKGVKFSIDTHSVDTGINGRDNTIRENFFMKFSDRYITGSVTKYSCDIPKKGQKEKCRLKVNLKMNGQEKVVDFVFQPQESAKKVQIEAKGSVDILEFSGSKALASLNKACFELHKGSDGVSKTWSTVDVALKTEITKKCDQ